MPRERAQLSLFSPPFRRPVRILTADDTFYRNMGAQIGARGNATNRDAELLALDEQELDAYISRTEEWLVSQVLFTGRVLCLDGDTGKPVAELDYSPISTTVAAKPWSDPTSNPLDDLKAAMRLVSGSSGYQANFVVMSKEAGDAFEANPNVKDAYNKYFIQPGVINPKALDDINTYGVTALGTYRQIALYVNEEQYEDGTGLHYYIPAGNVLIAADGLQSSMCYAAVAQPNEDSSGMWPIEGTRIPYVFWSADEEVRQFRLSARPVPVPANTASWTVLKGVA